MTTSAPTTTNPPQLQMVWPHTRLDPPPELRLHPAYALRTYQPGDEGDWSRVMQLAGFGVWDAERFAPTLATILPDGLIFAVHRATNQVVATAMATHRPTKLHPFGGELGWVAGDPAHKGNGLGWSVCAAVTRRFLSAGYRNIYLRTDDWRLPALTVYLRLGYLPFLFDDAIIERWRKVCSELQWPFSPESWPHLSA